MSVELVRAGDLNCKQSNVYTDIEQAEPQDDNYKSAIDEIDIESGDYRKRTYTFSPVVPDGAPTVLTFENITVTTKQGENSKTILHNVSGSIVGGFLAIMGSSGSGKTTLLSTLSLRLDSKAMNISGQIRLNGREYSKAILKSMSAYVMQDDVLHAELTVQETLKFASELRLPASFTALERDTRVQEVMSLMGIQHIPQVIVGDL